MDQSLIHESENDEPKVIFRLDSPLLFSMLVPRRLGLNLSWKHWKLRHIEILSDSTLIYRKEPSTAPKATFDLRHVVVRSYDFSHDDISILGGSVQKEIGYDVTCSLNGVETHFRCIVPESQSISFINSIKSVASSFSFSSSKSATSVKNGKLMISTQSVMRRAITREMETFDRELTEDRMKSRRGAMKCLPTLFRNDLVHGSWWFVLGSLLLTLSSSLIFANADPSSSFYNQLGEDDSVLSGNNYKATWGLMILSGLFCTLGSMAFVRAVHSDPPMPPLCRSLPACLAPHLSSDELLGSWLFLFATLPFPFYCLIYLSACPQGQKWIYFGGLAGSALLILGTFLFVLACYPQTKAGPQHSYLAPLCRKLFSCFPCCCSQRWLQKHFANDWLTGCWIIYWGTLLSTVLAVLLFLAALETHASRLSLFLTATGSVENVFFLVGSAYFIAGSYPEIHPLDSESHAGEGEGEGEEKERLGGQSAHGGGLDRV